MVQSLWAQTYRYRLDLNQVSDDKLIINLAVPEMEGDSFLFHFPKTIPGTYATQDFGKYISAFQAKNGRGEVLPVEKISNNTYVIREATGIKSIRYQVDDTFDSKERENKVFEPAGTNIQAGRNFVFNNAGFFGFFDGTENWPVELSIDKPADLLGITALDQVSVSSLNQSFRARSYHHLLDCPIMFAAPDTISFKVANATVVMSVFNESGRELSQEIYEEVKISMEAIAEFLDGKLPVDRYAFLFYLKDYVELGPALQGEGKVGDVIKLVKELVGQGFGALEHGNSSFYFLPDFGGNSVTDQIKDVCIHEFLHILTPLNLHSQYIGEFDYVDPKMSQHLWLYEGITEYFAGISQVKGGVVEPYEYLSQVLKGHIKGAKEFPQTEMSFTEMSTNVLEKPYSKQYGQVYVRGALLGALLDIEIMRLTNGEKTLKDVVVSLSKRYGKEKSFDEETFIMEFVNEVDPALQDFFDQYIMGKTPLDIAKGLSPVGVIYQDSFIGPAPRNPFSTNDNDIALTQAFLNDTLTVKKTKKEEWAGLKKGDKVDKETIAQLFRDQYGEWVAEGDTVFLPVVRKGETLALPVPVEYKEKTMTDQIFILEGMNPREAILYRRWMTNESLKKVKKEVRNMD